VASVPATFCNLLIIRARRLDAAPNWGQIDLDKDSQDQLISPEILSRWRRCGNRLAERFEDAAPGGPSRHPRTSPVIPRPCMTGCGSIPDPSRGEYGEIERVPD
jgi:hypothetical protein